MSNTQLSPRGVLGPAELAAVTTAYELALQEVLDGAHSDVPAHQLRRRLASAVMEQARLGTLDPEELKRAGLQALASAEGETSPRA